MRINLRIDSKGPVHTQFTVFVNGANAGSLCFKTDEAVYFANVISHGVRKSDTFEVNNKPSQVALTLIPNSEEK